MTRDALWQLYCDRNPAFAREESECVTLTVRGLRRLVESTWATAQRQKGPLCRLGLDMGGPEGPGVATWGARPIARQGAKG